MSIWISNIKKIKHTTFTFFGINEKYALFSSFLIWLIACCICQERLKTSIATPRKSPTNVGSWSFTTTLRQSSKQSRAETKIHVSLIEINIFIFHKIFIFIKICINFIQNILQVCSLQVWTYLQHIASMFNTYKYCKFI